MDRIAQYEVVREIARGGTGVVYEARGPRGERAALKLLLEHRKANPRARQRFLTEVKVLADLRHPHVVAIQAAGEHEGTPWLALDFVEGESLEQRLRRGPLPLQEAIELAQQLAQALAYVHACGILHRDLKPDNVLLKDGRALLTDFGLALDETADSRLTATGVFQGTPGYWAPEQAQGEVRSIGPRTDVYGLGAVLYACLTGRAPVEASSLADFLRTAAFKGTPAPHTLRADVPAWLSALCMECLASLPDERPASADAVARRLLLGEPTQEQPPRRARAPLVGVALVALLALLGGAAALWAGLRGEAQSPLEAIVESFEAGRYAESVERANALLAREPDHARAYYQRAIALWELRSKSEALADLGRAIELDPEVSDFWRVRHNARRAVGDAEGARSDAAHWARLEPRSSNAHQWLAYHWLEVEEVERALIPLNVALELDPNSPNARRLYAQTLFLRGRAEEALELLNELVDRDPSWLVHSLRGAVLGELGRSEEAVEDLELALRQGPKNTPLTTLNLGLVLVDLERYRDAVPVLTRAVKLEPSLKGHATLGLALAKLGRFEEAFEEFARAEVLDADSVHLLRERAIARSLRGDERGALADFSRALELSPGDPELLYLRGGSYLLLGRSQLALTDLQACLAQNPEHVEARRSRGSAYEQLGRYEEAIADFNVVLKAQPGDASALTHRGTVLGHLSRDQEALRDFNEAVVQDPDLGYAHAGRADILQLLGRTQEAWAAADRAVECDPNSSDLLRRRGTLHRAARRHDAALADFNRVLELEPEDQAARIQRSFVNRDLGDVRAALSDLNALLREELDPKVRTYLEKERDALLEPRSE